MEDRTIDMEVDGIRFISHGHYYDGINNWLCHKLKENDPQAITYCARQLVKMLPENAVVIPIPGHHGFTLQTLYLARAINEQSDGIIPVANVLKGYNRVSNYQAKKEGHSLSADERVPYLLDNCVDSGETAKAAYHALGDKGIILSYAMSERLINVELQHSSGLTR